MINYPKRLIEVDLPIKRISAHARREKSIRYGHISTLHIWWARRPLAACRAVICASLWPDPADELCPQVFRDKALEIIKAFADKVVNNNKLAESCHPETVGKYLAITGRISTNTGNEDSAGKNHRKKQIPTPELDTTDPAHLNRRVLSPEGISVVVFAHKSTGGWEALLQAIVGAGWIITGSWPIDTEMGGRLRAANSAALASSIHLVCRPRENSDGSLQIDRVGDWRDVLHELPVRIHEWMPRLAHEGVVGADAIFACLGPSLEILSRYSHVEKASGETVPLSDYLEEVWAAVSREALNMIFEGADATGFEEDARITAMWLWTLSTETNSNGSTNDVNTSILDDFTTNDDEDSGTAKQASGYVLEFDAARKIAQGLGVHLEKLDSLVEVKGDTARLIPVAERAQHLFGKDELYPVKRHKKRDDQMNLETLLEIEAETDASIGHMEVKSGQTTLDRIHQSMLLFSAGRSEALQRFLVEDGIGRDQSFWTLAQALSALYPKESDEKRWVDGVLSRKKGLGY